MTGPGCATPLTDVDLSMFIDGDADDSVIDHVHHCAACRTRAQRLQREQASWQSLFYRQTCPASQELCDYAWHLLPPPAGQRIEQHLAHCPHCTHELLNNYVIQPVPQVSAPPLQPTNSWWATAIDQLRILVSHITQPPTPALAYAVRGAERQQTFFYQLAEEAMLNATVEPDPAHSGRKRLELQLVGLPTAGLDVQLWQAQQLVQSVRMDAAGDASFDNLAAGAYELILSAPHLKIHIPHLAIAVDPSATTPPSPLDEWD